MNAAQRQAIEQHQHMWVPIDIWGTSSANVYSMEQGCVCGAFRIIDALWVEKP